MWKLWKSGFALSVGLLATGAWAQEVGWRTVPVQAGEPNRAAVTQSRPPAPHGTPAATLGRPVPLGDGTAAADVADPDVQPTGFRGVLGMLADPSPGIPAPDPVGAMPMPSGTPAPGTLSARSWKRDDPPKPEKLGPPQESADRSGGPPAVPPPGLPAGPNPRYFPFSGGVGSPTYDPAALDGCFGEGGAGCGGCCPPSNKFYATTEYLLWWVKGSPLPPLVTQGSVGDVIPGALGAPGTLLLFGNNAVDSGPRSGGRVMLGYWFGDEHCLGIEAGGFALGNRTTRFSATSLGTPILARPFVDAVTGAQTVELVAGPNALAGTVVVSDRSSFWGYETNLRTNLCCCCRCYTDLIVGFRALGLDEDLGIHENLTVLRAPGGSFVVDDRFNASNRFYGGQIGTVSQYQLGRWSLDFITKLAIGNTSQTVQISGSTVINDPRNGQSTSVGGLLAQPSNIGRFHRDLFGFVPEVGINVGYQLTDHCRLFLGYNLIYWTNVVRPGNQIDLVVNTAQLPPAMPGGPARPAFAFHGSDFWAQGVNFGLEFRY
jgi:hypothetical protein